MRRCWLVLLVAGVAHAQEYESELLERVLAKPDMGLVHPMQGKRFEGGREMAVREARGADEGPVAVRPFHTEVVRETRSFLGVTNPWFGRKVFRAERAPIRKAKETFETDAVPVRASRTASYEDAGKENPAAPAIPVRAAAIEGSAQGSVDRLREAVKRELTVEEIREILNKPR